MPPKGNKPPKHIPTIVPCAIIIFHVRIKATGLDESGREEEIGPFDVL